MKLTVDRKSWHFRIAKFGGIDPYGEFERGDLCQYFWCFSWGVLKMLIFVVLGAAIGYLTILQPAIALIVWFREGILFISDAVWAAIGCWSFAAFFAYLAFFGDKTFETIGASSAGNLIKSGYRGWKEKTCLLIEVK